MADVQVHGFLPTPSPVDGAWQNDRSRPAVLDLTDAASAAIIGAPGSGKTTLLIDTVAHRVEQRGYSPDQILVLAPTRSSATRLRDRLAIRLAAPTNGPLARTAGSLAFQIVAGEAAAIGQSAPKLLTGGEQDQIIADLLSGFDEDAVGPLWPEHLGARVRSLRGFRTELRDLMMRCVEYGVSPAELARLGRQHDRPEWLAASDFITTYDSVKAEYRDNYYDSAELVRRAAAIVDSWPLQQSGPVPPAAPAAPAAPAGPAGLRLILLDDAQESTQATLALVAAFARRGVTVLAFGDPDISIGSFRGAKPDALGRLGSRLGIEAAGPIVLDTVYRGGPQLRTLIGELTARIGAAAAGRQRAASSHPQSEPTAVHTALTASSAEQIAVISRLLRERHVSAGVPWTRMAVVVRSGSLVPALAKGLSALEVPTSVTTPGTALRDERVVVALILALDIALGRRPMTSESARELVLGALCGLDTVALRRLIAALRQEELAGGNDRSGDDLLVEALSSRGAFTTIDTRIGRRAASLASSITEAASEAEAGGTIEELLWGLWQRSGLAASWLELSQGSGIAAQEAARDLDAVVELFSAATRFVERTPEAPPTLFLDQLVGTDVPEDTLAPRSTSQSVTISTPAAIIGEEFDIVVIAGVQDGVWPNLRVRGTLLGAQDVAAYATGGRPSADPSSARTEVMHDELRMFAQAASRATTELLVTAVVNEDNQLSPFFELLPEPDGDLLRGHPWSLRGMVGRLRRELTSTGNPAAASSLARLAAENVPGAAPDEWYGLADLSSSDNLVARDAEVRVSPSEMDSFETCGLGWLIGELGGSSSSTAMGLGTIIHKAMEDGTRAIPPSISEVALRHEVDSRWGELRFESGWDSARQHAAAHTVTRRLAAYLRDFEAAGGTLAGNESVFTLPIDLPDGTTAVLSGKIDRVERLSDGRIVIVDVKTGKNEQTSSEAVADHAQLGAYQLAFASGAIDGVESDLPSGGAKLVIVSKGTLKKDYYEPLQRPFDHERIDNFVRRVQDAAAGMSGAVFAARIGSHCLDPWSFGDCTIHVIKAVSA